MKKLITFCLIITPLAGFSQMTLQNLDIGFNSNREVQKEYVYSKEKLKVYVVKAKASLEKEVNDKTDYTPLESALQNGLVKITEVSEGGEVNQLLFENQSNKTVLLQLGDVITGGKQDRVVREEKILRPKEKAFVGVYCVEKGRWSSNGNDKAEFKGYHSKISNDVRRTIVMEKSQQAVWREVDNVNGKNKTENRSGTYAAMSNNLETKKEIQQYVDFYNKQFNSNKEIVGLVAVSGNQIIGCDIFGTTKLFQSNLKQILNSYATEAVLNGSEVTMSDAAVNEYLQQLLDNEEQQAEILKKKGSQIKSNGKNLKISAF